jgi:hypothetical protein
MIGILGKYQELQFMKIYKIAQSFGDLLDDYDILDDVFKEERGRTEKLQKKRLQREKRNFSVGKRVQKTMGCMLDGTIIPPFDWNQSDDGTYKPPTKDHVPVLWQDGSKGYENKCHLEVIVE